MYLDSNKLMRVAMVPIPIMNFMSGRGKKKNYTAGRMSQINREYYKAIAFYAKALAYDVEKEKGDEAQEAQEAEEESAEADTKDEEGKEKKKKKKKKKRERKWDLKNPPETIPEVLDPMLFGVYSIGCTTDVFFRIAECYEAVDARDLAKLYYQRFLEYSSGVKRIKGSSDIELSSPPLSALFAIAEKKVEALGPGAR